MIWAAGYILVGITLATVGFMTDTLSCQINGKSYPMVAAVFLAALWPPILVGAIWKEMRK
jgi:hypothetical protein